MSKNEENKVNWAELSDSDQENGKQRASEQQPKTESTGPTDENTIITLVPKKSQKKEFPTIEEMIAEVKKLEKERVYIFLNSLSQNVTEEDIRAFYKDYKIAKIFAKPKPGAFDVQFDKKEDAIKFLGAGTGRIQGRRFFANISRKNYHVPEDDPSDRPRKEKYDRYDRHDRYDKNDKYDDYNKRDKYDATKTRDRPAVNPAVVEYKVREETPQSEEFYKKYKHKDTTGEIKRSNIQSDKKETKLAEEKLQPKEEVIIQKKGRGEMKFLADGDQQLEQDKIMEGITKSEDKKNYKDSSPKNNYKERKEGFNKYDTQYKQRSDPHSTRDERPPKKDYYSEKNQSYKKKNYSKYDGADRVQNSKGRDDYPKNTYQKSGGERDLPTYQVKKTATAPSDRQKEQETQSNKKIVKNNISNPFGALDNDNHDDD